jgi:hypothetical protein
MIPGSVLHMEHERGAFKVNREFAPWAVEIWSKGLIIRLIAWPIRRI